MSGRETFVVSLILALAALCLIIGGIVIAVTA